jgi:hypothetical protein
MSFISGLECTGRTCTSLKQQESLVKAVLHARTHTHMFTDSVGLQRHDLISFQQHMQSIPQRSVLFNNFVILYIYIYIEKQNYEFRNRHSVKAPFETVCFRLSS